MAAISAEKSLQQRRRLAPPAPLRSRLSAFGSFTSCHLSAQGLHQHRLDDQQDVVLAGVVRAQLGALGLVDDALEQRAEDRGVDVRPVVVAGAAQGGAHIAGHVVGHGAVVEQPAVEVGDAARAILAAAAHGGEQLAQAILEFASR